MIAPHPNRYTLRPILSS